MIVQMEFGGETIPIFRQPQPPRFDDHGFVLATSKKRSTFYPRTLQSSRIYIVKVIPAFSSLSFQSFSAATGSVANCGSFCTAHLSRNCPFTFIFDSLSARAARNTCVVAPSGTVKMNLESAFEKNVSQNVPFPSFSCCHFSSPAMNLPRSVEDNKCE